MSTSFSGLSTVCPSTQSSRRPSVAVSKSAKRPAPSPLQHPAMQGRDSSSTRSLRSDASASSTTSSIWKRSMSYISERRADETPEQRRERKQREADAYSFSNPQFWNLIFRA